METETLDKLYLEWSQFTQARTARELSLQARIDAAAKVLKDWHHMGECKCEACRALRILRGDE